MFRDLPILDALKHVASADEWRAYDEVRSVQPPPVFDEGYPGQEEAFALRQELEAPLLARARRRLESGQWEAVGRREGSTKLKPIDRRLWPGLEFELPYGRVAFLRSKEFISDLFVSELKPMDQSEKRRQRGELTGWFKTLEKADEPPRGKSEWLCLARSQFPELTDNMFNQVWASLGHPHSLKLKGRPQEH